MKNTKTTLLSREQEMELLAKAQSGDKASRDMLVELNLPLIKSVVRKYKDSGLPWEDLVNEGVIGLMKAIDEFDIASGNKLSTFATYKIKQVAVRALENNGRTVRIPVYRQAMMMKVKRTEGLLTQSFGRATTNEEIASYLEITLTDVKECKKLLRPIQSLDVQVGEDDGSATLMDMLEDGNDAYMTVEEKAMASAIDSAISSIKASDRDKEIIKKRFGIGGREAMTLEAIGAQYSLTRERIRQIESTMLGKLASVEGLKSLI